MAWDNHDLPQAWNLRTQRQNSSRVLIHNCKGKMLVEEWGTK